MQVELTKEEIILVMASLDLHLEAAQVVTHGNQAVVIDEVEYQNWRKVTSRIRDKFWSACRNAPGSAS